jgi:hypothetical protein
MVARKIGYGEGMTDAQLVEDLAQVAGTTGEGTSGNGIIAMYEHMGLETEATPGADLAWINAQLDQGRYITALGDYYQVPGRVDAAQTAGHYIDVTDYREATKKREAAYVVRDPADRTVRRMSVAELQSYITSAPTGGFAIAAWQAEAAAAAAVV